MREFLKGMELDKEQINTIMAEHGKLVTEDKEEIVALKSDKQTLTERVAEVEAEVVAVKELAKESETVKNELDTLKQELTEKEELKIAQAQENELIEKIKSVYGDKKFVNEYTEKAIIDQIKEALKENADKPVEELFEEFTKEQDGLFVNPNSPAELPEANESLSGENKIKDIPLMW